MQYPKTIRAAKAVSTDEKAMASAIYAEIPPKGVGRPKKTEEPQRTVEEQLHDMADELRAEGHDYSPATLDHYRNIAVWAAARNSTEPGAISWQPVAWNTHLEAYDGGMTWATFTKHVEADKIKTGDDVRRILGKKTSRKVTSSEKVREVKDLIASGQVAPDDIDDLADALPDAAVSATHTKRVKAQVQDQHDAQHDDDSPEEIAEFEGQMNHLLEAAGGVQGLVNAMADQYGDSPFIKYAKAGLRNLSMALVLGRKHGVSDHDRELGHPLMADIHLVANQGEQLLDGATSTFSESDLDFMEAHGLAG